MKTTDKKPATMAALRSNGGLGLPSEAGWWWTRHKTKGLDLVKIHQARCGGFAKNVDNTREHYLSWWDSAGWGGWVGPFESESEARQSVPNI